MITSVKSKIIQILEPWFPYLTAALIGYFAADLIVLYTRPLMLPRGVPASRPPHPLANQNSQRSGYNIITSRNIFSFDGKIPDPLIPKGQKSPSEEEIPVATTLPLTLIGTIVHFNPDKSVATIEIKGKNQILAFRPKTEIEGLALIVKVERNKVIIRNINSNRLEFLESKQNSKISFKSTGPVAEPKGDIQQVGQNQFTLKRSDLLKHTSNLASILQQARSVPNRNPQTGEIDGFRILDFQPGSIYEQLGINRMDVIKGVNGEPVDNPTKAMELYNALKSSDKVVLQIDRGGKQETLEYSIKN
jgi:general secretion pathway protein C